jgi:DNA sulfur modification protein DndD
MRIERITMQNYRQYQDIEVTFPKPTKDRNFYVIQGANGSGKTNFLNAVTWCLFGEESNIGDKSRARPIINNQCLDSAKPDSVCTTEVQIEFRLQNEDIFRVKRTLGFRKSKDGGCQPSRDGDSNCPDGSRLTVWRQIGKDVPKVNDPAFVLKKNIPKDVREYFFFDGERLDQYFRSEHRGNIKEAVFKISQLELLDRAMEHLESVKTDFVRENKSKVPELQNVVDRIQAINAKLKKFDKELREAEEEQKKAEIKQDELNAELIAKGSSEIKRLGEERRGLLSDARSLEGQLEDLSSDRIDSIFKGFPIVISYNAMKMTREAILSRLDAGDIPPLYRREFIDSLLRKGECICGSDLKNSLERQELLRRKAAEVTEISDISEDLTTMKTILRGCLDDAGLFKDVHNRIVQRMNKAKAEYEEKAKALKAISDKIQGPEDVEEKMKQTEEMYKMFRDKAKELGERVGYLKGEIFDLKADLANEKEKETREMKKSIEQSELISTIDFCKQSLSAAEDIKNDVMEQIRKEVEKETQDLFLSFIWKKNTYAEVKIDENYNISVPDRAGREQIGQLAAGERQLLALSFMAALNKYSGFDVPIIIDTPLARIGSEPREMIASRLPKFLSGKQVILLALDTEYTDQVRQALEANVVKDYRIEFKELEDGSSAKVVSYE